MKRVFGIALWVLGALTLAPGERASAQQVSACVNNSSGAIHIVGPNATCTNNEVKLVLGGALAGADYQCVSGGTAGVLGALNFQPSSTSVSFGSAIGTTGGQFNSFVLQQGIYQIHLSGTDFTPHLLPGRAPDGVVFSAALNGNATTIWFTNPLPFGDPNNLPPVAIVGGDRLVSVGQPNTTLQILNQSINEEVVTGVCELVITKLQ